MARQRLTRQAEQNKQASPPPAMPAVDSTEGPDSPAYYPDPKQDKYEKGDTSAWAEDPHKPMSPESPPPAMPGNLTTDKLEHPATSEFQKKPESPEKALDAGGGGGKSAAEQPSLKKMAEARAALALRVATALMPNASAHEVESRAIDLMDLDDAQLSATAATLKLFAGEEEEMLEESDGDGDVVEEELEAKTASHEVTARLERLEAGLGRLVKAMSTFFGMDDKDDKELLAYLNAEDQDGDGIDQSKNDFPQGYDVEKMAKDKEEEEGEESEGTKLFDEEKDASKKAADDDMDEEAMLRAMLEEMDEEMGVTASAASDSVMPLAKGQSIQSGEGGNVNPSEAPKTPQVAQSNGSDKSASDESVAENDIDITAGVDPLGLMETDKEAALDDELSALYADFDLPKTAGEEEEMEVVEDEGDDGDLVEELDVEEKEAGKKAADLKLRPQPKNASTGAQRVGAVSGMPKAARNEIAELEKMWETAPNVMSAFGLPKE